MFGAAGRRSVVPNRLVPAAVRGPFPRLQGGRAPSAVSRRQRGLHQRGLRLPRAAGPEAPRPPFADLSGQRRPLHRRVEPLAVVLARTPRPVALHSAQSAAGSPPARSVVDVVGVSRFPTAIFGRRRSHMGTDA